MLGGTADRVFLREVDRCAERAVFSEKVRPNDVAALTTFLS